MNDKKNKAGRPRKSSDLMDRFCKEIEINPNRTADELAELLNGKKATIQKYAERVGVKLKKNKRKNRRSSNLTNKLFKKVTSGLVNILNKIVKPKKTETLINKFCKEAKKNPNRTANEYAKLLSVKKRTIQQYAKKIGIKLKANGRESKGKRQNTLVNRFLKEVEKSPNKTVKEFAELLNCNKATLHSYVTRYNIKIKTAKRGYNRRHTIENEIEMNPNRTVREIADKIGSSYRSIYSCAKRMNVKLKTRDNFIIRRAIKDNPKKTAQEISNEFGLNKDSILQRAKLDGIKLKTFTQRKEEIAIKEIKSNPNRTVKDIAIKLGYTRDYIGKCFEKFGLKIIDKTKLQTIKEEVKKNPNRTIMEVAEATGFNYNYTYVSTKRLGIELKADTKCKPNRKKSKILQTIEKNQKKTANEIARIVGCPVVNIASCAKRNKIILKKKKDIILQTIKDNKHKTAKEIAKITGCSRNYIAFCAKKYKYEIKMINLGGRSKGKILEDMSKLYKNNPCLKPIQYSIALDLSISLVLNCLKELGISPQKVKYEVTFD